MTKANFEKSVRMFRKFSEETLRRRENSELGREGVAALVAIEAVLKGERLFDGTLLEPLQAFTSLLQSAQLPPEFGDYGFGDALLAIEEAHAEVRTDAEQRWEFAPELDGPTAARLTALAPPSGMPSADAEHVQKLRACVQEAALAAKPGWALVVGALRAPELPLAELAKTFERLTLSDMDLAGLEALVRREVPEQHRQRVQLERYDLTGSYAAFAEGAAGALESAKALPEAEAALAAFLQSYDVGAGSAGLCTAEGRPDLAISALVLSELGPGYARFLGQALAGRGFDQACLTRAPLGAALELQSRLVEQHHIHALLRRSVSALLISAVSEVTLTTAGKPVGEPRDLLGVESLVERLPQMAQPKQEHRWEWRRAPLAGAEKVSLLTLVEAVLV